MRRKNRTMLLLLLPRRSSHGQSHLCFTTQSETADPPDSAKCRANSHAVLTGRGACSLVLYAIIAHLPTLARAACFLYSLSVCLSVCGCVLTCASSCDVLQVPIACAMAFFLLGIEEIGVQVRLLHVLPPVASSHCLTIAATDQLVVCCLLLLLMLLTG